MPPETRSRGPAKPLFGNLAHLLVGVEKTPKPNANRLAFAPAIAVGKRLPVQGPRLRITRLSPRSLLAAAAVAAILPISALAQTAATAPAPAAPAPVAADAAAAAPKAASPNLAANGNIVTTLKASAHFTILAKALDQAQLTAVLSSTPGLTLFAPTDDAFNALPPAQLQKLLNADNAPILQKILIYHLVNASLDSTKIKGAKGGVPSVETAQLQLDGSGDTLKVNDASIIQPDVRASNGIIQVVDKVLIPADVTLPNG